MDRTNRRQLLEFFERIRKQKVPNSAQISAFWQIALTVAGARCGSAAIPADESSVTVQVADVTADSLVFVTIATNDVNIEAVSVLTTDGGFTISSPVTAGADTRINWFVIFNPPTDTP